MITRRDRRYVPARDHGRSHGDEREGGATRGLELGHERETVF